MEKIERRLTIFMYTNDLNLELSKISLKPVSLQHFYSSLLYSYYKILMLFKNLKISKMKCVVKLI